MTGMPGDGRRAPAPPPRPAAPAPHTPPQPMARGKVWFIGAGPGAADLLTLRAAKVIAAADIVIWASSLVQAEVLDHARPGAQIVDSAALPLEDVRALYERALAEDLVVARIHSGDPALWGAVQEQRELCDRLGLPHETVPGVSAYSAVAALAGRELTVPELAQSVILTRLGGGKTPMPAGEEIAGFARHGTTMAVFLSAARSGQLQAELLDGGYPPDTPVLVAYRATWPDELLVECTVGTLAETVRARKLWKHTLFLVGPALAASGTRSHLYHPGHFHEHRRAQPQARHELRTADAAARGRAQAGGGREARGRDRQSGGGTSRAGAGAKRGGGTSRAGAGAKRGGGTSRARGRAMTQPGHRGEPELTEPDLPRTAKVRPKALRTGWTTGTCASAAAKAATTALRDQATQRTVEVALPSGRRVSFDVESCVHDATKATAVVVKDAGDDPDVTHGAHLTATVRWRTEPGILLEGGEGVGIVTKPGLGIEVGEPAITATPRAMITQAVAEVTDLVNHGVVVLLSVPGGEKMARKTTNARLGILGGISILGTTGIVRPFSTASWRASVEQAVSVMAAQGERTMVLCTGGRTEKGAMALLPDMAEVCFVEVGDFTGAALRRALAVGLDRVIFVGMAGKLAKLAAGVLMTHYTRSKVDLGLLGDVTLAAGGSAAVAEEVSAANTGRHAYEILQREGLLRPAGDELCQRVRSVLLRAGQGKLTADVAMVDFSGARVVAATRPEWVTAA
jgi:cobalt-precorrin-5B (C1)-methyltransferase